MRPSQCSSLGHELTVELPQVPVCLDGDSVRLTQVFANLLDNACKYMACFLTTGAGGACPLRTEVTPIALEVVSKRGLAPRRLGASPLFETAC
jgi:signal transduction histidine kinase